MASIRSARTLAALAAVPVPLGAVGAAAAQTTNASPAEDSPVPSGRFFSAIGNVTGVGTGVGGGNTGNSTTTLQSATGAAAFNESNVANLHRSPFSFVDQSDKAYTVVFTEDD